MEPAHLITFNLTLLAALMSPGPAMMYAMRASIAGGFRAGFATGVGLGLMAACWTALALLGLGGFFALVPWAYGVLKLGGALYLIWIAYGIWRDARSPVEMSLPSRQRAFVGGVLVNLANPKSVLFASAVLLVIFPGNLAPAQKALIVANHFAVECVVYGAFAAALSSPPVRAAYLRAKPGFDRIAAAVLGALGLRLLFDRT
ncbi:Threonine/homoserine/homoserine lactone efflux protein [Poseidonocella pacifica]|uniref:Threonine/homoserine/homoserine lactone efflux protein n=1 Tax=Poseidonocella pacifica TaxID=871651 RepID=A0A1I0VE76_9RHOB|nr:LysE family translocator [Poseidonocella pacifica]SFA74654.1 Threonine/homoserine/homoserine lactone efflux protein [Poseidonocella pacifica]